MKSLLVLFQSSDTTMPRDLRSQSKGQFIGVSFQREQHLIDVF